MERAGLHDTLTSMLTLPEEYCIEALHPVVGLVDRHRLKESHSLLPKLNAKLLLLFQITLLDKAGLPEGYPSLRGSLLVVFFLILIVFQ